MEYISNGLSKVTRALPESICLMRASMAGGSVLKLKGYSHAQLSPLGQVRCAPESKVRMKLELTGWLSTMAKASTRTAGAKARVRVAPKCAGRRRFGSEWGKRESTRR